MTVLLAAVWLLLDYPWGLLAFVAIAAVHTARAMRRPRSVGVIRFAGQPSGGGS
jgi:hypothetical protein